MGGGGGVTVHLYDLFVSCSEPCLNAVILLCKCIFSKNCMKKEKKMPICTSPSINLSTDLETVGAEVLPLPFQ